MVDEEGNKEDEKLEFDSAGEALGYISLDQARLLAIQHARDHTEFYGRRYGRLTLAWEVISQEESEDYYDIRLSFRPAGRYRGEPGVEQFIIYKTGAIELRHILDEPSEVEVPRKRMPVLLLAAVGVVVLAAVVGGVLFASGTFGGDGGSGGGPPVSALTPTNTSVPPPATAVRIAVLAPTQTPTQPAAVVPTEIPTPIPTPAAPTPTPVQPKATVVPTAAAVSLATVVPTNTPAPTATPSQPTPAPATISNPSPTVSTTSNRLLQPWRPGKRAEDIENPWRAIISSVVVSSDNLTMFASTGGSQAALYKSSDHGDTWRRLVKSGPTSAGSLVFDAGDSGVIFGQRGGANVSPGWVRSSDGGDSWELLESPASIFHVSGGSVFAGGAGTLFRSNDQGKTWRETTKLTQDGGFLGVPGHPEMLSYRFTSGAEMALSTSKDAGLSWTPVKGPGITTSDSLNFLNIDFADPPNIQVGTVQKGLYQASALNPEQWSAVLWPPDVSEVRPVAVHPTNPEVIAVSTEDAIFATFNGGITWIPLHQAGHLIGNVVFQGLPPSSPRRSLVVTASSPPTICMASDSGIWCHRGAEE